MLTRGTLVLSTDPAYPPQSYAVKGAKRLKDTKCLENQLTANQIDGYDADTGKLVAKGLAWSPLRDAHLDGDHAGQWGDRWDIAYGSGRSTPTGCRASG